MNQELDQAVSDIRNQTVDDAVVEAARTAGSQDNITSLVIFVG